MLLEKIPRMLPKTLLTKKKLPVPMMKILKQTKLTNAAINIPLRHPYETQGAHLACVSTSVIPDEVFAAQKHRACI